MAGALRQQMLETPTAEAEQSVAGPYEQAEASCNYDACSRAYRSFRASDCTYQPFLGTRKLCEGDSAANDLVIGGFETENSGDAAEEVASADVLVSGAFDQDAYEEGLSEPAFDCDYDICSRAYRSFRASDCSYQPNQGRRKSCVLGDAADGRIADDFDESSVGDEDIIFDEEEDYYEIAENGLSCNYEACSRAYSSFRDADCTYQPYRGRRRLCEK